MIKNCLDIIHSYFELFIKKYSLKQDFVLHKNIYLYMDDLKNSSRPPSITLTSNILTIYDKNMLEELILFFDV